MINAFKYDAHPMGMMMRFVVPGRCRVLALVGMTLKAQKFWSAFGEHLSHNRTSRRLRFAFPSSVRPASSLFSAMGTMYPEANPALAVRHPPPVESESALSRRRRRLRTPPASTYVDSPASIVYVACVVLHLLAPPARLHCPPLPLP